MNRFKVYIPLQNKNLTIPVVKIPYTAKYPFIPVLSESAYMNMVIDAIIKNPIDNTSNYNTIKDKML